MKRKSILLCTLLILCLFVACGASDDEENTSGIITGTNEVETETEADLASQMAVEEYIVEEDMFGTLYTRYFVTVTNNSKITVKASVNAVAKDAEGNIIGTADSNIRGVASGETICLENKFSDIEGVDSFEYTLSVAEDVYTESAYNDIEIQESRTDSKIILTCTNVGEKSVLGLEGYVFFFVGGEVVGYDEADIGDYEITSGTTVSQEFSFKGEFDDVKYFVHGQK